MISRSVSQRHINLRLSSRKAAFLAISAVLGGVMTYKLTTDEGMRRGIKFVGRSIVPLVKYRYYDWKTKDWPADERTELFRNLHEKYAPVAYATTLELRGFYIKFAQIMSGMDGLMPKQYVEALKPFQNNCPSRDIKDVIKTIEEEFGVPFSEIFLYIDPKPLGSASIGQTHRAKLRSGETVVVKVQHPEAEKFFRGDVAAARFMAAIAQPEQLAFFDEIEKMFQTEFDYFGEAQNLRDMVAAAKARPEFAHSVVIPEPLFVTRKVLVMTYVNGETLQSKRQKFLAQKAEAENRTVEEIEAEMKEKAEKGELDFQAPAPWKLNAYRAVLKSRDAVRNSFALTYNVLFGYLSGSKINYEWTELPMKSTDALDTLYHFYGYTLFHHGIFSSDPHGGNVMHSEGEKLGLIDMGQVKRIDLEQRIKLARLVVALSEDKETPEDNARIAKYWRECGYATKRNVDETTADNARFNFDRMSDSVVLKYGGIHVFMEEMEKIDPMVSNPDEYIMAMRASLLIRMNALGLGHGTEGSKHSRVAPIWAKYAKEFLAENGETM